jgi:AraC-like DNA-binding protein
MMVTRVRMERIGSEKVDAIALDVGYRSKKNFYRIFKSLTGLTPSAFRQLPKDEQHAVIFRAKRRSREVILAPLK